MPEGAVIVLIGTKIDLPKRKVSTEEAASFAKENKMAYYEVSPKDTSAEEIETMVTNILQNFVDTTSAALVHRCIHPFFLYR
jgi:hypothetical protein